MSTQSISRKRVMQGMAAGLAASTVLAAGALVNMDSANAKSSYDLKQSQVPSPRPTRLADMIARVKPAVVNIAVTGQRGAGGSQPAMPDDFREFFQEFFGRRGAVPQRQPQPERYGHGGQPQQSFSAQGSGFIIAADGYVVTNHHVVEHAESITVVLDDGKRLQATLKGVDPQTDLALLKVQADKALPYVSFGSSDEARVGDWVVAIGNPFGLGGTATTGIISARGRDIQSGPFDDFIQIDAPINKGNSGGPLFNVAGEVIGINTAIYSPHGGSVGIGFAVPAGQAQPILAQLQADGSISRGWLGVQIQPVTDDLAAGLGLKDARGALVADVTADSPAAIAGLKPGDVILRFNGQRIDTVKHLTRTVAATTAGKRVAMKVWRSGERQKLHVKLGERDAEQLATKPAQTKKYGLALMPLDDRVRHRAGLDGQAEGVFVRGVANNGHAAKQGLRAGDVILQVGNKAVEQPGQVLKQLAGDGTVVMLIQRNGYRQYLAFKQA